MDLHTRTCAEYWCANVRNDLCACASACECAIPFFSYARIHNNAWFWMCVRVRLQLHKYGYFRVPHLPMQQFLECFCESNVLEVHLCVSLSKYCFTPASIRFINYHITIESWTEQWYFTQKIECCAIYWTHKSSVISNPIQSNLKTFNNFNQDSQNHHHVS